MACPISDVRVGTGLQAEVQDPDGQEHACVAIPSSIRGQCLLFSLVTRAFLPFSPRVDETDVRWRARTTAVPSSPIFGSVQAAAAFLRTAFQAGLLAFLGSRIHAPGRRAGASTACVSTSPSRRGWTMASTRPSHRCPTHEVSIHEPISSRSRGKKIRWEGTEVAIEALRFVHRYLFQIAMPPRRSRSEVRGFGPPHRYLLEVAISPRRSRSHRCWLAAALFPPDEKGVRRCICSPSGRLSPPPSVVHLLGRRVCLLLVHGHGHRIVSQTCFGHVSDAMPAGHGSRARTRDTFSRGFRQKGVIPVSTYLRTFKIGDYVDIKVNSAVHKVRRWTRSEEGANGAMDRKKDGGWEGKDDGNECGAANKAERRDDAKERPPPPRPRETRVLHPWDKRTAKDVDVDRRRVDASRLNEETRERAADHDETRTVERHAGHAVQVLPREDWGGLERHQTCSGRGSEQAGTWNASGRKHCISYGCRPIRPRERSRNARTEPA